MLGVGNGDEGICQRILSLVNEIENVSQLAPQNQRVFASGSKTSVWGICFLALESNDLPKCTNYVEIWHEVHNRRSAADIRGKIQSRSDLPIVRSWRFSSQKFSDKTWLGLIS